MDRNESIRKHTSDMLSVERHILEAVQQQRDEENVKNHAEVNKLIIKMERMLNRHVTALENLAKEYGADTQSTVKETVTKLLGVAAGLYDKVRGKHPLSRDLRDDYTALSLASMGYTTYHSYGLTVKEDRIASLASEHLKEITPLMVEISKLLPSIVVKEVQEESDFATDTSVADQAVKNTQEAWSKDVTESAAA